MNQTTTWTAPTRHHETFKAVVQSYVQLTKPRIIPLLLIETAAAMWVASQGEIDPVLLMVTLLSGTLAAASAQTINCVYDRDIDFDMERTRHRPIPAGRIQVRDALVFAGVLAVLSFGLQAWVANLLSAGLAMLGIAIYVGVYTLWLKRSSPQNIVIGGAAGAIPPLVGWAAVTGDLPLAAWLFFAIVFIWTPPHFWGLAMLIQDDYAKVNVPMMPVIAGDEATAQQIWYYTLVLVPLTLMMTFPLGATGAVYAAIALVLGVMFIQRAWALLQAPSDRDLAKGLFKFSILYMMLLSAGMVVDSWPVTRALVASLSSHLEPLISMLPF
ncbi:MULTISPECIES: heme o synthase [Cyanophyceae]|uniref:heme o synthase n=1 Tax=Cyanophyceae TaxID=3028117 RepID=UPI001686A425|nr:MULTISPECIES: heme o synthase [Cyanophyceae]MBD1916409.1 protoheme IX farnesyltransferase [Phormidium sp. FACHB-77]MBD2032701.1 protoheme IX farnesyltransferase [Phormidium sp. FACHB-322]MBD2050073.1 protoheme IX farnesyltransferase [Leptolyngbya sp. FACHB-60]